jgi:polyphosphate glucokinase
MNFLGVDIGCTSIKYGLVSLVEEIRISNFDMIFVPQKSRTEKYIDSIRFLTERLSSYQAAGFGFPSVVLDNQIQNLTIEFNAIWLRTIELFQKINIPCFALNDADAAGIAEVYRKEASVLRKGVTVVITLGTGIGSAVFLDGKLLPNTEMGLFEVHGMRAENYAAPSVKTKESLSWVEWSCRLQEYLFILEKLLCPDHLVLGGGISADFEEYSRLLSTQAPLQPAFYRNQAGVVGAAMFAAVQTQQYDLQ